LDDRKEGHQPLKSSAQTTPRNSLYCGKIGRLNKNVTGVFGHHVKYGNTLILSDIIVPWNFIEFNKFHCRIWKKIVAEKWLPW